MTLEQQVSRATAKMQRESAAFALLMAAVAFLLGGVAGWAAHVVMVSR